MCQKVIVVADFDNADQVTLLMKDTAALNNQHFHITGSHASENGGATEFEFTGPGEDNAIPILIDEKWGMQRDTPTR